MSRRTAIRIAATLVAAGAAVAAGLVPALPAAAHGAPTDPISRTVACSAGNDDAGTAACKAARKANGEAFGSFDNLRVAGVNGRDKAVIPDGKLCSGSLPEFKGLDLPRGDYPATRLTPGATLNMRYRGTIPHAGVFRIYLTKQGFNPQKPLRWEDLGSQPFLTENNPPLKNGSYRIDGKLPKDRTGRHVLYTVWETTSTPDTYYSCSDVIFPAAAKPSAPASSKPAKPAQEPSGEAAAVPAPEPSASAVRGSAVQRVASNDETTRREVFMTAVVIIMGGACFVAFLLIRRARRDPGTYNHSQNR